MRKPAPMIRQHQHTRQHEQRIPQLNNREMPQITRVHRMTTRRKQRQEEGEGVEEVEEAVEGEDGVDEEAQEAGGEDRVLFD